jgi:hypothetical protein
MSCTHDCGCTPEIRDARTDEWVQIAPESARPATLTPERPVKAPGRDGDIFLARGKPVEVEWPSGNRRLRYVDEGGYRITAGEVGDGAPCPWHEARIVRVLTEDKPAQEPVLPRRIKPEDVRVGMVVERRKGEAAVRAAVRDRVRYIDGERLDGERIDGSLGWPLLWMPGHAAVGWSLWLIEDAPEPVDPDAELVERMAKEVHDRNCADGGCRDWDGHGWDGHGESTRKAWRDDARVVLRNLRAQGFDVTARAEQ